MQLTCHIVLHDQALPHKFDCLRPAANIRSVTTKEVQMFVHTSDPVLHENPAIGQPVAAKPHAAFRPTYRLERLAPKNRSTRIWNSVPRNHVLAAVFGPIHDEIRAKDGKIVVSLPSVLPHRKVLTELRIAFVHKDGIAHSKPQGPICIQKRHHSLQQYGIRVVV